MKRALFRLGGLLLVVTGLVAYQGCGEIRLAGSAHGKVGTFFFFWHDCVKNKGPTSAYPYAFGPDNSCPQTDFVYHPQAMGVGAFPYSAKSLDWYVDQLQQMKLAGIDYAFPVYWGDHPQLTFFNIESVSLMVNAIDRIGSDLKLGLFDDTSSQVSEWNYDNGRDYNTKPAMNLADSSLWIYFYDRKVLPFFRAVPQRMWATHNGESVENGGRPIIVTWVAKADAQNPNGPSFFDYHGAAASLWHQIKQRFREDFGVEPFLIFETSWYNEADDLDVVGDAQYSWGTSAFHARWHQRNGYVVSSAGPGYDDHLVRKASPRVRPRDVTHGSDGVESTGDSLAFFRNEYLMDRDIPNWENHGVRRDSDLVFIETWNELYEGTGIEAMHDWPDLERPGQRLAPDTYSSALRELKRDRPGYRDYDHTLVSTRRDPNGTWNVQVRNDGAVTWKKGELHLGFRIHDGNGKRLHADTLAELTRDLGFGESFAFTFPQPQEWTDTARFPAAAIILDVQLDGTWFTDLGDGFLIRPVLSTFPGLF